MSNIKVYLRIRPEKTRNYDEHSLDSNEEQNDSIVEDIYNSNFPFYKVTNRHKNSFITINNDKKYFNERKFAFERIFPQETKQEELYGGLSDKILDCAMNGVS